MCTHRVGDVDPGPRGRVREAPVDEQLDGRRSLRFALQLVRQRLPRLPTRQQPCRAPSGALSEGHPFDVASPTHRGGDGVRLRGEGAADHHAARMPQPQPRPRGGAAGHPQHPGPAPTPLAAPPSHGCLRRRPRRRHPAGHPDRAFRAGSTAGAFPLAAPGRSAPRVPSAGGRHAGAGGLHGGVAGAGARAGAPGRGGGGGGGRWRWAFSRGAGAPRHSTAQHSTAQHSTAQHSTAQHSTAQHSTAQHGAARWDSPQGEGYYKFPVTTRHGTARHSTAQRSAAQRSAAQHSAAQRSAAQRSTAQHSTAQHSTAQRANRAKKRTRRELTMAASTPPRRPRRRPGRRPGCPALVGRR